MSDGVTINGPSGNCPVQADGVIDGHPFYFRARHEDITMSVALPGKDAVLPSPEDTVMDFIIQHPGGEFSAGWMHKKDARKVIDLLIEVFRIVRAGK